MRLGFVAPVTVNPEPTNDSVYLVELLKPAQIPLAMQLGRKPTEAKNAAKLGLYTNSLPTALRDTENGSEQWLERTFISGLVA